jgi:hypothetical protein
MDVDLEFLALIDSVKMRRRMIAIKHPDNDAVKPAQFRHRGRIIGFRLQARHLQTATSLRAIPADLHYIASRLSGELDETRHAAGRN